MINITLECPGENAADSFDIWEETVRIFVKLHFFAIKVKLILLKIVSIFIEQFGNNVLFLSFVLQDCNGEIVGFVAQGCYVEDFNMSIDWSLQSFVVEREEQAYQLPDLYIDLKAYCAPYNLSNSQKRNCTESSEQDNNSKENSSFSTPKTLQTESNNSKDSNNTESSTGNLQKENNIAETTLEGIEVCLELEENPVNIQETLVNAQMRVDKARENVNYTIYIVENAQKDVQKIERLVDLARFTLEKTVRNLVKARESVDKALNKVDKVQRRLEKAQQEVKRVLNATLC